MTKTLMLILFAVALGLPRWAIAEVHVVNDPLFGPIGHFDDWGFPQSIGRDAFNFSPINGFGGPAQDGLDPNGAVSLIQREATVLPDGATQDPPLDIVTFGLGPGGPEPTGVLPQANMDGVVNLFLFGWTGPAGSQFNLHQVDRDGDHFIPKDQMSFNKYEVFVYRDADYNLIDTIINPISFQPVALSDARGWCAFQTHPASAGEAMAGQVQFAFGFQVFFGPNPGPLQIVPHFPMRSYGTLVLDFNLPMPDGTMVPIFYVANSSANNTDPSMGRDADHPFGFPSPDFYNHVSFAGGGIIPLGVWVTPETIDTASPVLVQDQSGLPATVFTEPYPAGHGESREDGAVFHRNMFGGFPFMLRADALRTIDFVDNDFYGAFDHDIIAFEVTKKVTIDGEKKAQPVNIKLVVKNEGSVDGATSLATVVGMQGDTKVFKQSQIVSMPSPFGAAKLAFGPFLPMASGGITWTATIADADPDDDTAVAVSESAE